MRARWQSLFDKHGPALALLILLSFIGLGIHAKSSIATVPPFFDSLSYYTKAKRVWEQFHKGWSLRKTLNVEPAIRPPGATLVSYPFGFSKDYRGFFFRSVFVPIAIWMLALWLLVRAMAPPGPDRWTAACLVGGFASFSMFYHFDFNPALDGIWNFCHTWGMQDCFIASLGALATSLVIVSAKKRSLGLAFAGSLVAAWTLLVKPAGMLLMMLVSWTWLVETCIRHWPVNRAWKQDRGLRSYFVVTACTFLAVFATVFVVCVRSKYLSVENWKFMSASLKVLYRELLPTFSLDVINSWVSPALGWHWFVFLAVAIAALATTHLARAIRRKWQPEDWRFPAALLGLSGALYWWLFMAGLQIRYFFPFILVFLTAIFPDLLRLTSRLQPWSRGLVRVASITPAILVSGLVLAKQSPIPLQRAMGVSVTVANETYRDELQIGEALVAEVRKRKAVQAIVYSLDVGVSGGIVHAVGETAYLNEPEMPVISWTFSLDWTRGSFINRTNLLNAGYVLYVPSGNAKTALSATEISDWPTESALFTAWLDGLDEDAGVQTIMRNSMCLLRIVDRQKLNAAFEKLVATRKWRELFTTANALTAASAPSHRFGASGEILFHASPTDHVSALRPNAGMSITPEAGRIVMHTTGSDPGLQLPDLALPANRHVIVRVALDSPARDLIHLRYALEKEAAFGAIQTVVQEVAVGSNELYFLVPCDGERLRMTLCPGPATPDLTLQDIEVRAVP